MNRMADAIAREQVLPFRVHAQQLDSEATGVADAAVLDFGVQDTGPDGGLWALAIRGVDVSALSGDEFATVWTIRGAPHLYRRSDLPVVAAATWPFSDSDAGRRIFDASKPLKQAGIGNLEALDAVAAAMQTIVTEPLVKGEVSTRLTPLMDKPYRRFCRPCNAIHLYEMPFRLAALRAGLELQAGTSPPVMQPIPGFTAPASAVPDKFDVIRGYLRFLGPATPKQVADFLDAPISDVKARWPSDAVEVSVEDETRWVLDSDVEALAGGPIEVTRLLGPFDLFLQARDRSLLVDDPARAKALWPVLGRPGGVMIDAEVAGMWRPRKSGSKLNLQVELWSHDTHAIRAAISKEAERLAAFRAVRLGTVNFD